MNQTNARSIRRDGWTVDRQLHFLHVLARTRSATKAAGAAGMSRESAYRLRRRPSAALFAAAWDRALGADRSSPSPTEVEESHIRAIARACDTEAADLRLRLRRASTS